MVDLHTANLKFMNNTLPVHHQASDTQTKIKIADLNNALDNIMTLQSKAQSPNKGTMGLKQGHQSFGMISGGPPPPPQINADLMINTNSALSIQDQRKGKNDGLGSSAATPVRNLQDSYPMKLGGGKSKHMRRNYQGSGTSGSGGTLPEMTP